MNWKELLEDRGAVVAPWTGEGSVYLGGRSYRVKHRPRECGWFEFLTSNRDVVHFTRAEARPDELRFDRAAGYLSGDQFVPDVPDKKRWEPGETVHLVPADDQRDHFDRVVVGRHVQGGPLVYAEPAPPLGPEDAARRMLDEGGDLLAEEGVTPGLYAAFLLERDERARAALARRQAETRRLMGTAEGRRELAGADFDAACAAALRLADAEFLSSRTVGHGEHAVRFRLVDLGRRFECVVDAQLSVIEAGICLTDHYTGEKGDRRFTLESLPSVIREAHRDDVLVVFRHV